jgi:hypothetical protein
VSENVASGQTQNEIPQLNRQRSTLQPKQQQYTRKERAEKALCTGAKEEEEEEEEAAKSTKLKSIHYVSPTREQRERERERERVRERERERER